LDAKYVKVKTRVAKNRITEAFDLPLANNFEILKEELEHNVFQNEDRFLDSTTWISKSKRSMACLDNYERSSIEWTAGKMKTLDRSGATKPLEMDK